MALKWVIGSWLTGQISETAVLPVTKNSDKFTRDIHAEEEVNISVSKRDLPDPSAWKTYLQPGERMVALIDDSVAWNADGAVLFAGPIIRVNGRVKDTISVKAAGVKEWLARRVVSSVLTGITADPNAGVDFKQATYREALIGAVKHAFTVSSSNVAAPNVYPAWPSLASGTLGASIKNSDFMKYSDAMDAIIDNSPGANEYQFNWAWTSSAKTKLVFSLTVGTDSVPQINAGQNVNITLDSGLYKLVGYQETSTVDGFGTRLVAQSTVGDADAGTGSDFQAATVTSGTQRVLWDQTFNPGVELTSAQMTSQITSRLNFMANLQGTAEIEVIGDRQEWLANLGKTLTISGGSNIDTSGYSITVRIVEVGVSVSDEKIVVKIMPLSARYPKLPKPNKSPTPRNPGNGPGGIGGFNPNGPIVPRVPSNQPIGGGGDIPIPGPPPLPNFDTDNLHFAGEGYLVQQTVEDIGSTNSLGGNAVNYFQDGQYIYRMNGGNFISTKTLSPSSLEELNDELNSLASSMPTMQTRRLTFTNATNPLSMVERVSFNLLEVLGGDLSNLIPNFSTMFSEERQIKTQISSVFWVDRENIYIWVFGTKNINTQGAIESTTVRSTFGSKIFKNTLTGSPTEWVEVASNPINDDGKLIYPLRQEHVIVHRGEAVFSSMVYLEETPSPSGEFTKSPYAGVESIFENTALFTGYADLNWMGKYDYGIQSLNLNTMAFKRYQAPAWTNSTSSEVQNTSASSLIEWKHIQTWLKAGGNREERIGLLLLPVENRTDSRFPFSMPEFAFAYWHPSQASVQVASSRADEHSVNRPPQFNFFNRKGELGLVDVQSNYYSRRTKNSGGQIINSSPEPSSLEYITNATFTIQTGSFSTNAVALVNSNRLYTSIKLSEPQVRSPIFTYNDFWFAVRRQGANQQVIRGTFNDAQTPINP